MISKISTLATVATLVVSATMASAATSPDGFDGRGQVGIQSQAFKHAAANSFKVANCDGIDTIVLAKEIEADILKASAETNISAEKIEKLVTTRVQNLQASFDRHSQDVSWICSTENVEEFANFSVFTWSQIPAE